MGSSWLKALLLVSAILILSLSLSHGSGREIMVENVGYEDNNAAVLLEERARELMQLDYIEAGPNFNPRTGNLFSPPPPQSPPPLTSAPPPHHPRF